MFFNIGNELRCSLKVESSARLFSGLKRRGVTIRYFLDENQQRCRAALLWLPHYQFSQLFPLIEPDYFSDLPANHCLIFYNGSLYIYFADQKFLYLSNLNLFTYFGSKILAVKWELKANLPGMNKTKIKYIYLYLKWRKIKFHIYFRIWGRPNWTRRQ